jgi:TPP-dependent indolepyruvate ferredoxin oxidoreductase alpha subunit
MKHRPRERQKGDKRTEACGETHMMEATTDEPEKAATMCSGCDRRPIAAMMVSVTNKRGLDEQGRFSLSRSWLTHRPPKH